MVKKFCFVFTNHGLQIMVCIYAVWLVGFIKLMDDAFGVLICGSVLCL